MALFLVIQLILGWSVISGEIPTTPSVWEDSMSKVSGLIYVSLPISLLTALITMLGE